MMDSCSGMRMKTLFLLLGAAFLLGACSPLGIVGAAGVGLGAAATREGGISGTLSDTRIHAEVADKLFKYDLGTFSKVGVTVDQARVLLSGVVQNPEDRVEAVRAAWQVRGVRQVINEIKVANSEGVSGFVRDAWITTRLRTALTFDDFVQNLNYSIDTVQGTVYLMGVAQSRGELDRALRLARTIPGVRGVVSYVKIEGVPEAGASSASPSGQGAASPWAPSSARSSAVSRMDPAPAAFPPGPPGHSPAPVTREPLR